MPLCTVENVLFSRSGGVFAVGWVDDYGRPISRIVIAGASGLRVIIDAEKVCRVRRSDVEKALSSDRAHPYGFWGFAATGRTLEGQKCDVTMHLVNGAQQTYSVVVRCMDDHELRDLVLGYLAANDFFGNRQLQAAIGVERGLGAELVSLNRTISSAFCSNPYVESFGNSSRKIKGSIIVCLYGKAEFMFLQAALFSGLPGIEDYEFVYVSNSPELSEQMLREARVSSLEYGLNQTLVLLGGNAGFGAANNIATRYAHSNRYLIVNPDVFPYDREWAAKHTQIVERAPAAHTQLFGAPLFYDDGSLMHGGMYFELDSLTSLHAQGDRKREFVRVEHYGKGAPASYTKLQEARPVPAVTGAFMSLDRRWYEELGGFTEDFVFGHYEDADLCLKSLAKGVPAWIQDIKLYHLEGKGSTRRAEHEGGSTVNRWLFSKTWGDFVRQRLNGQSVDLSSFISKENRAEERKAEPATRQKAQVAL